MSAKVRQHVELWIGLKRENTQRSYRDVLEQWCEFLKTSWKEDAHAGSDLAGADCLQALAFISKLKRSGGRADGTVAHRFHVLRGLYKQLVRARVLDRNPFDEISGAIPLRQKTQVRPTKMLRFDLISKVLDAPDKRQPQGIRDSALLAVLFGGGLRRSEARKLNCGDYQISPTGQVFLQLREAKSGENQQQSVAPWVVERLANLISQRKAEGALNGDPLFVFYYKTGEARGRRIDESTLYRVFKRYCKQSGIEDAAPHSARATAASFLKWLGFEDRDVQDFLRHKHPGMVQIYDKRARGLDRNPGLKLDFWASSST